MRTLNQFLDRASIVADSQFNRWLIPPAALAVHMSIGQAYSLSVFNIPMSRLIGIDHSAADDWSIKTTVWIFNIAFFFLGLAAALFGTWVERIGPRKAIFIAALCFSSGFFISALGVYWHTIALVYLGYGVLGGIGLGIGYIAPVSTLMKWFPDRPGMATGMAIMGFGGGALLGSPLAVVLMNHFKTASTAGVWETLLVMGCLYLVMMMYGMWNIRLPAASEVRQSSGFNTSANASLNFQDGLSANEAIRTPQFWLVWLVLCMNVTAGIGILAHASPMIQEIFPKQVNEISAAGFVGLLSLFNLCGRLFWSSLSDRLGRQRLYTLFFVLGIILYACLPTLGEFATPIFFVLAAGLIVSMYGGGFAALPAYLKDLFGMKHVGAIQGRVLTAWSTAAILGPTLVSYVREFQLNAHVPAAQAYFKTLYILIMFLVVGLIANWLLIKLTKRRVQDA